MSIWWILMIKPFCFIMINCFYDLPSSEWRPHKSFRKKFSNFCFLNFHQMMSFAFYHQFHYRLQLKAVSIDKPLWWLINNKAWVYSLKTSFDHLRNCFVLIDSLVYLTINDSHNHVSGKNFLILFVPELWFDDVISSMSSDFPLSKSISSLGLALTLTA